MVLIPALIFAAAAYLSYQRHFAQAQERLTRDVDILYEQSVKVFETLDLVAGRVDELLAGLTDEEIAARENELSLRTKAIAEPLEQVQFVLVINAKGHPLVFSALFPAVHDTDYSGRDYFRGVKDNPGAPGTAFVSAVLQGRLRADNTTFLVAVPRGAETAGTPDPVAPPAPFRGVIAISTKPAYFVEHFRQIAGHDLDSVALLRADGAVLARYPGTVGVAARLSPNSRFMTSVANSPQQGAYEAVSGLDGVRRLSVYRRLPHHPIYVAAGIDRATVLAEWHAAMASDLLFGIPATGGLVLFAFTALRRARGEAVAVTRLAERTRELDRLWRTSRDLFAVGGQGGVLYSTNPAWSEVLGLTPDEIAGLTFEAFIHPDDQPAVMRAAELLASGKVVRDVDLRLRAKDGSEHWFSWTWVPDGILFYASGRDITERRQLSEQLRQAQKMEAVGQLTGGIAHDFNNMLAVIIGSLDLLGRRLGTDDARITRYIDAATNGARRAALLTQQLLAFSRQQPLRPEDVDINKLVDGMSELIGVSLGSGIQLELILAADAGCSHVDQNQLTNVLLNLVLNARDAMPDGGQLTIETRCTDLDASDATTPLGVPAGPYVLIAVTDTGCGMPENVIAKAFDPFFTTKEVGKGTGLGLSQVYGFVKQSGGHVTIDSEVGHGSTLNLYLPRLTSAQPGPITNKKPAEMPHGRKGEVSLVIEDEPPNPRLSVEAPTRSLDVQAL